MINQKLFDEIADQLVEQGIRVTYDAMSVALRERDRKAGGPGQGKSHRDLQQPLADWRRRRRYHAHLARLDLPEDMEKAIAAFVERAMAVAKQHADIAAPAEPVIPPEPDTDLSRRFDEFAAGLNARIASLIEENRALRDQVDAPIPPPPAAEASPLPLKREERRRGLAAATGRFFWDRMMTAFAEAIRENGPMNAAELMEVLDDDALAMAEAMFEKVTTTVIREKLLIRINAGKLFRLIDDERYALLPRHAARAKRLGKG